MIYLLYIRRKSDSFEASRPYSLYEYSIADAMANYCDEMECDVESLVMYISSVQKITLEDYLDGI